MKLHWQDLENEAQGAVWKGLDLRVETDAAGAGRPGLHMQAWPPRLMRLMAGEWPLLWARVESDHYGYWYLRRPLAPNSPGLVVPPITAPEARAANGTPGSREWFRSWSRAFAQKLLASPLSPLHADRWSLTAGPRASVCLLDRLPAQPSAGYVAWDIGDALEPLALRPMSGPDDARVKAWRRASRENYLPPALLMWISGLDRHIVLDGHDRIAAALAEGTLPNVLVLCHLRDRPHAAPVSRAWPLDGGARRWRSQVSAALTNVTDEDVRRGLLWSD